MSRSVRRKPPKSVTMPSNGASPGYTAEQREQLRRGLRILARMIVRAHLRGAIPKAALPSTKPPLEKGSDG